METHNTTLKQVVLHFTDEDIKKIDEASKKEMRSRSNFIKKACVKNAEEVLSNG